MKGSDLVVVAIGHDHGLRGVSIVDLSNKLRASRIPSLRPIFTHILKERTGLDVMYQNIHFPYKIMIPLKYVLVQYASLGTGRSIVGP